MDMLKSHHMCNGVVGNNLVIDPIFYEMNYEHCSIINFFLL